MKFTYKRSGHDKAVDEIFGSTGRSQSAAAPLPCVLIGFVNRSGSNYLAELLRSTGGFSGLEEPLNDHSVRFLAPRYGVDSLAGYVTRVHREQAQDGTLWGMKAGWMQLAMLLRTGVIPGVLAPRMVTMRRRDVVGQAISLFIAEATGCWTATDQATARGEVAYDGQRILNTLRGIVQSTASLQQVALLGGVPCSEIVYEDLVDAPVATVSRLSAILTGRALDPVPAAVKLRVQRDSLDERLRRKFLADLPALQWDAV